jgi:predicted O-linked N-acetylglucosamine transferase (SPINDLY family)
VAAGILPPDSAGPDTAAKLKAAIALHRQGRLEDAEAIYLAILRSEPTHLDALQLLAMMAVQRNNFVAAVGYLDRILRLKPDFPEALNNRGNALVSLQRFDEALDSYDLALAIKPNYADALVNRGKALVEQYRLVDALDSYDRALESKPDHVVALFNRGNTLVDLHRLDEALDSYDLALALEPDRVEALCGRGNALAQLDRLADSLQCFDRAITIKPDYAEAHCGRGSALTSLRCGEDALQSYDRALRIKPDYAGALCNRSTALLNLERYGEALESCDRALRLKPDMADALHHRGLALAKLNRLNEAVESYGLALKLKPDFDFLYGTWLYARMRICSWANLQSDIDALNRRVSAGERVCHPFIVLGLSSSPALQLSAARLYVQCQHPASLALPRIPKRPKHDRIRVGYFSADYRTHPVSLLAAGLFETHDRKKFEVTAFSLGPDTKDELRIRLETSFEKFIDVRNRSEMQIAMLARSMEIDIAVDLGGFTEGARVSIFAMRAAPLQLGYLGYLGTMGAAYYDYLVADQTIIPNESRRHYEEKIIYLPSYQINDAKRRIAEKVFTREELGLPRTGFVFCCFNNNYKIAPTTFDVWIRILKKVEGSVLWLLADNPEAMRNLRKEAALRGIDADRLVFGERMPAPEYLARYRTADLFLDTLPYNAGATASDALWAGLPVLTCTGEAFSSRMAASLLDAIELPELVTATYEEYEALAIDLATDPNRLRQIKRRLEINCLTTPLFNTDLSTRHIEDAYVKIYERYHADLPPDHISVPS